MLYYTGNEKAKVVRKSMMKAKVYEIVGSLHKLSECTSDDLQRMFDDLNTYDDIREAVCIEIESTHDVEYRDSVMSMLHKAVTEAYDTATTEAIERDTPVENDNSELVDRIDSIAANLAMNSLFRESAANAEQVTTDLSTMISKLAEAHIAQLERTSVEHSALLELAAIKAELTGGVCHSAEAVHVAIANNERDLYQRALVHCVSKMGKSIGNSVKQAVESDGQLCKVLIAAANASEDNSKSFVIANALERDKQSLDSITFKSLFG